MKKGPSWIIFAKSHSVAWKQVNSFRMPFNGRINESVPDLSIDQGHQHSSENNFKICSKIMQKKKASPDVSVEQQDLTTSVRA